MTIRVYVPTPFRRITGNRTFVDADGVDVSGVLRDLEQRFPGFGALVFDAERHILEHVNVYVNNQEISALQGAETAVNDGDEVSLIPAIAGGAFSPEEVDRYSRHLIMEQVGPLGQRKIQAGKVLAVGAGGLGSPVLVYLAAAGVGTIGVVDFDVVDRSNLQRQIIHGTSDIGRPKVESAADRMHDMNPHVTVVPHSVPLTSENAMAIISQYDIVVNGADNFATRYLVNDACFLAGKPLVDGSIFLFEGQVSTFLPGQGWQSLSVSDAISWDLTEPCSDNCTLEFDITNIGEKEGFNYEKDLKFLSMGNAADFGGFGSFRNHDWKMTIEQRADYSSGMMTIWRNGGVGDGKPGDNRVKLTSTGVRWDSANKYHFKIDWATTGYAIYINGDLVMRDSFVGIAYSPPVHRISLGCYPRAESFVGIIYSNVKLRKE